MAHVDDGKSTLLGRLLVDTRAVLPAQLAGVTKSGETELALLKTVSNAYPTVTTVRVKDAITQVNNLVAQLAWAIRGASSITLIASILVLAGALAAGHRSRIYDAVILKTIGATRTRLIIAYGLEYAILGFVTSVFAVLAGGVAAWYVITGILGGSFTLLPGPAFRAALLALVLTVGFGLIGGTRPHAGVDASFATRPPDQPHSSPPLPFRPTPKTYPPTVKYPTY